MIYTAIDTFYLTDQQVQNSPSRKDGLDETTLRIYGCDLIQECGILLKLPQAAISTAQVLFHRFYCKKSFSRFNVKRVAASCVYLAAKLEEDPRRGKHVIMVFHRSECRRENLPIQHLDLFSEKYKELRNDLIMKEMHLLKELGFVCHVEHPHKFILTILTYLARLEMPSESSEAPPELSIRKLLPELSQEAWNLANDSLRTTLCLRFRSNVVACGVVYAAARRRRVPMPENSPWWELFDVDISGINEVCRVLARLYTLPKAQYIPVCREEESFISSNTNMVSPAQPVAFAAIPDSGGLNGSMLKIAVVKLKESKKSADDTKEAGPREDSVPKYKTEHRTEASREKNDEQEREREREWVKLKSRGNDRDRNSEPRYKTEQRLKASRGNSREREWEREKSRSRDREWRRDSDREYDFGRRNEKRFRHR